jgi:hypothetical protein
MNLTDYFKLPAQALEDCVIESKDWNSIYAWLLSRDPQIGWFDPPKFDRSAKLFAKGNHNIIYIWKTSKYFLASHGEGFKSREELMECLAYNADVFKPINFKLLNVLPYKRYHLPELPF